MKKAILFTTVSAFMLTACSDSNNYDDMNVSEKRQELLDRSAESAYKVPDEEKNFTEIFHREVEIIEKLENDLYAADDGKGYIWYFRDYEVATAEKLEIGETLNLQFVVVEEEISIVLITK
jgi:hypothetical protein